tara:strand:- start:147 stop:452 length:306 start_codon:yes stop_codon:yes gene_type:complete
MIKNAPITYKDWIEAGFVLIPCDNKQSAVSGWSKPDFKITVQDWENNHIGKQMSIRLENHIDLDVDNNKVKFFINKHIKHKRVQYGVEKIVLVVTIYGKVK